MPPPVETLAENTKLVEVPSAVRDREQNASRPENAAQLRDRRRDVRTVIEHVRREHAVERRGRKRKRRCVTDHRGRMSMSFRGHAWRQIDADGSMCGRLRIASR